MDIQIMSIENPHEYNFILGQTHFIKSVEDLYEAMVISSPGIKFGVAFCEASGPCLVRFDGNNEELINLAKTNAQRLSCGHSFIIFLKDGFPINVLNAIKMVPEVCCIFCATANPCQVVMATTDQGNGILGVIDGYRVKGMENESDMGDRKALLQKIGYKR
ncbi:MAG: adenosine-specific kinase [Candidatus Atribacteria bacterium]|nr:adenosine-specific kinase [Candidatus Atribacteria bacterium]